MSKFTMDYEKAKRMVAEMPELLDTAKKASVDLQNTIERIATETDMPVLQEAAKKVTEVIETSYIPNLRAISESVEQLDGNVKIYEKANNL